MVAQRTQPTELTILAQLRTTRDADADARFRALLIRQRFEQRAPELVAMVYGGAS